MRKKRKKKKKQRKYISQLFRLCSYLKELISDSNANRMEDFNINWNFPWKKSAIKTEIDQDNKIIAVQKHRNKILALLQNHFENIIIYSDGSKLSDTQAGAGCYISYAYDKQKSYSWHLKSTIEVFDIELFAILKSLQLAKQNINSLIKNI